MFNWEKKGKIFETKKELNWSKTHTALPTPFFINSNVLRIYYTSRDKDQKSRISYLDVDSNNPLNILKIHDNPILELGSIGTLDDVGMTSSFLLPIEDKYYFFYTIYFYCFS